MIVNKNPFPDEYWFLPFPGADKSPALTLNFEPGLAVYMDLTLNFKC